MAATPARLILEPHGDGLRQMAADAWLCRSGRDPLHLRLYQWTPWTLSLGHSQAWDPALAERCQRAGVPVVRRETGGRAVYHADELTYCVTIPVDSPFHTSSLPEAYARINRALARGLERIGVPCGQESRRVDMAAAYRQELGGLCFAATARSEVLWDGRKLVGSAQRQLRHGLLQHGSLMLGDAHYGIAELFFDDAELRARSREKLARSTTCLSEILGQAPEFRVLAAALAQGFEEEYHVTLTERPFDSAEEDALLALRDEFLPEARNLPASR
ncbi:MAG: lipoate--protein ligase family protein [Calditrichaeota bacterium]|nr:lipoate--protein ligase family protein [Candidatus Cloacimonadota bacterium]MCA9786499.1 lipoate--protein ligase family protein [Candidatus Cloacimonadota bacterium]MCB1045637.1 lipoate--protein ligase family protein [Calditrichota bacterium]MCB9474619.1 lipoate--protein ligase family protein [Candidatus Delongbacteria bacterium]